MTYSQRMRTIGSSLALVGVVLLLVVLFGYLWAVTS